MLQDKEMIEAARRWVEEKGWNVEDYDYRMSSLQSCPEGQCSVDVVKRPEDDMDTKELSRLSRVLEIDTTSGKIENVLAGRDPQLLSKLLELEKIYTTTNAIGEELAAKEQKRKAEQEQEKEQQKQQEQEKQQEQQAKEEKQQEQQAKEEKQAEQESAKES